MIVIDVAIDPAGYQSKIQQEKAILQVFFFLFTRPFSPSDIYVTLLLPLLLLTTTAKINTIFIGVIAPECPRVLHKLA